MSSSSSSSSGLGGRLLETFHLNRLNEIFKNSSAPSSSRSTAPRPVKVILPLELGGGFTMLMCFPSQKPSVGQFIHQSISMCQATNPRLLDPREWGLTLAVSVDSSSPTLFLSPTDSLVEVLHQRFPDHAEATLELARLRRTDSIEEGPEGTHKTFVGRKPQPIGDFTLSGHIRIGATAQSNFHIDRLFEMLQQRELPQLQPNDSVVKAMETEVRYSGDRSLFKNVWLPSPTPLNQKESDQRYVLLRRLKEFKAPADIPKEVVCLLLPQYSIEAKSFSSTRPVTLSMASSNFSTSLNNASQQPKKSKGEIRLEKERQIVKQKETDAVECILRYFGAKGIGNAEDEEEEKKDKKDKKGAEDEGDDEPNGGIPKPKEFADGNDSKSSSTESVLFFIPMPTSTATSATFSFSIDTFNPSKKVDPTQFCFVMTTHRALQLESGFVVKEMKIGIGEGSLITIKGEENSKRGTLSPPSSSSNGNSDPPTTPRAHLLATSFSSAPTFPCQFYCKRISSMKPNITEDSVDNNGTLISFELPSPACVSFVQSYVHYMQGKLQCETSLEFLQRSVDSVVADNMYRHGLMGWTHVMKSFVGPLVFSPLRTPMYQSQIKQVLATVQQMDLKQVNLTSLKLTAFQIPQLTKDSDPTEADTIPSVLLRGFKPHPINEYLFEFYWNCPDFLIRVEIQGKKIMTFKLELELRGVEVSGSVKLRSSPFEPSKLAINFPEIPSLSVGVYSHVVLGSINLPFQKKIERLLTEKISSAIERALHDKLVKDSRWIPLVFEQSAVTNLIGRYASIAKYPFKFDGKDDEDMMALALVITTQAETLMKVQMKQMQQLRDKLERAINELPQEDDDEKAEESSKNERESDNERKSTVVVRESTSSPSLPIPAEPSVSRTPSFRSPTKDSKDKEKDVKEKKEREVSTNGRGGGDSDRSVSVSMSMKEREPSLSKVINDDGEALEKEAEKEREKTKGDDKDGKKKKKKKDKEKDKDEKEDGQKEKGKDKEKKK